MRDRYPKPYDQLQNKRGRHRRVVIDLGGGMTWTVPADSVTAAVATGQLAPPSHAREATPSAKSRIARQTPRDARPIHIPEGRWAIGARGGGGVAGQRGGKLMASRNGNDRRSTPPDMESMRPQPKTGQPYVFRSPEVDARDGIPGCVIVQYRRCGKPRCHCAGPAGRPHGPYFSHYWRAGGRARKRYVARADAPRVVALCDRHRALRLEGRATARLVRGFDRLATELLALLEGGTP